MKYSIVSVILFCLGQFPMMTLSFSASSSSSSSSSSSFGVLDRFRVTCPADTNCIQQFEESLISKKEDDDDDASTKDSVWVAVYRSNNNQPSVFVRDDFFHAMNAATTESSDTNDNDETPSKNNDAGNAAGDMEANQEMNKNNNSLLPPIDNTVLQTPMALEKPVAVAQLRRSTDYEHKWVLDSLRCCLKKENLDDACDGGSEFTEALSVCVDSLLLYHLQNNVPKDSDDEDDDDDDEESTKRPCFEGVIRTKATLFSNKLIEERGFEPVEELSKDMATHVSKYNACLQAYAERSASLDSISAGARDRALQIVSLLGRLENEPLIAAESDGSEDNEDDGDDGYDPWANSFNMLR